MRYLYLALMILLTAAVLVFTGQNLSHVTVRLLSMQARLPLALLVIVVYILGMFTGSSLLMLVRTWLRRSRSGK